MTKTFLHVGPGINYKDNTTDVFNTETWKEVRLDINEDVEPDILASMTNLDIIDDNSYDAIYSAHNIEHVFPHEVDDVFNGFKRVLKDDGFLVLTCPDIKKVCKLIGEGNITQKLYDSDAGPIYPLDVLYGLRRAILHGNEFMAHKHGFTSESLLYYLKKANFKSFCIAEATDAYALWLIAYKGIMKEDSVLAAELKSHIAPRNQYE